MANWHIHLAESGPGGLEPGGLGGSASGAPEDYTITLPRRKLERDLKVSEGLLVFGEAIYIVGRIGTR